MAVTSGNILVLGGTGNIGKFIVDALIEDRSSFGRIGIFTSEKTFETKRLTIQRLERKGVQIVVGDLSKDVDVVAAYKGKCLNFDTVISALGRTVLADQARLIRLAEESTSIERFFPSEYGTDIEYWPESQNEIPHQQKLKIRKYIKDNVKKLEYTYIVTGPYADLYVANFNSRPELGTFDVAARRAVLLGNGNGKVSLTTMADAGRQVVAALKHREAARNRALRVNSYTTTPNEILAEFERQTGEKWDVSYISLPELELAERLAWEKGDSMATSFTLRRIWTQGGANHERRDNADIEAPETETLVDTVRQAIQSDNTDVAI